MLTWFNAGAKFLWDAAGSLILSSDNRLDFYVKIELLLAIFLKSYRLAEAVNNFEGHILQNDLYHGNNQHLVSQFYRSLPLILFLLLVQLSFYLN